MTPRYIANKVPEVTFYFWIIKVLGTTVGETAADFLNVSLNLGLTGTSLVTGVLLMLALLLQFRKHEYVPSVYWSVVVLLSVFGTLVTDNLTDSIGVPLESSTIFFSVALVATLLAWYAKERTLSIHSIVTARREAFYWLAILATFALGTAAGDLMAEGLGLGYLVTGAIVAAAILIAALAWKLGLHPTLAFWIIYVLTRPLGASLGDLLSQPRKYGGLGLGATATSVAFVLGIVGLVAYLSITRKDVTTQELLRKDQDYRSAQRSGWAQVIVTILMFAAISGSAYAWRRATLEAEVSSKPLLNQATGTPTGSPLGDLS